MRGVDEGRVDGGGAVGVFRAATAFFQQLAEGEGGALHDRFAVLQHVGHHLGVGFEHLARDLVGLRLVRLHEIERRDHGLQHQRVDIVQLGQELDAFGLVGQAGQVDQREAEDQLGDRVARGELAEFVAGDFRFGRVAHRGLEAAFEDLGGFIAFGDQLLHRFRIAAAIERGDQAGGLVALGGERGFGGEHLVSRDALVEPEIGLGVHGGERRAAGGEGPVEALADEDLEIIAGLVLRGVGENLLHGEDAVRTGEGIVAGGLAGCAGGKDKRHGRGQEDQIFHVCPTASRMPISL